MTVWFYSSGDPRYRFLSNFWSCGLVHEGRTYTSAEHLYQALKTDDPDDRERIRQAVYPLDAKGLGGRVALVSDFDRVAAMTYVLDLKFRDPGLRQLLLETGASDLREDSQDRFWGGRGDAALNVLGRLLVERRERARGAGGGDFLTRFIEQGEGRIEYLVAHPGGAVRPGGSEGYSVPAVILPGSFNPLHDGHRALAAAAGRATGERVAYELSMTTVDKPSLSGVEVRQRARQFENSTLLLTRAPRMWEKADLFPGVTFAVGYDTAVRVLELRFYGDAEPTAHAERGRALRHIGDRGCSFLVGGRERDGRFMTVADLVLPGAFKDLFVALDDPALLETADISSIELREELEW